MNRDEIYDHLAQVYLGKGQEVASKKPKERKSFHTWLAINIFITAFVFASVFYGLTASLKQNNTYLKQRIIASLSQGVVELSYNFLTEFPAEKSLVLSVPPLDATRYINLQFNVRAKESDAFGTLKIMLHNRKNEKGEYYISGINSRWQKISVPLSAFKTVTDKSNLTDVSFVVEPWNVQEKHETLLIENVQLSL